MSLIIAATSILTVSAQKPKIFDLWPNGCPTASENPKDTARVWLYLPKTEKATGRAIVICPGGGYSHLAMNHEGHDWAPFFNNMGIAVMVLKYRMPHGCWQVPVEDAEEAVKMLRRNAS